MSAEESSCLEGCDLESGHPGACKCRCGYHVRSIVLSCEDHRARAEKAAEEKAAEEAQAQRVDAPLIAEILRDVLGGMAIWICPKCQVGTITGGGLPHHEHVCRDAESVAEEGQIDALIEPVLPSPEQVLAWVRGAKHGLLRSPAPHEEETYKKGHRMGYQEAMGDVIRYMLDGG